MIDWCPCAAHNSLGENAVAARFGCSVVPVHDTIYRIRGGNMDILGYLIVPLLVVIAVNLSCLLVPVHHTILTASPLPKRRGDAVF